jgi:DnaA-homolog protein
MEQLLLDLSPDPPPARANYFVGPNVEAAAALDAVLAGRATERQIYLWGGPGTGKTHLLRAVAAEVRGGVYLDGSAPLRLPDDAGAPVVAVDDVDSLDDASQAALFDYYNRVRGSATVLLFGAATPPLGLSLRRDLASRLAWGWTFELRGLSEREALEALGARAQARGIALPEEVLRYVSRRCRRDLRSLTGVLDAVERHALRTKRAITLPLLREALDRADARASTTIGSS